MQARHTEPRSGQTRRAPIGSVLLLLLGWCLSGSAGAVQTISETFMGGSAPGWIFGGSTTLTSGGADPAGQGWLRLTPAAGNQAGYAYYDTAYSTANGFVIEFEYGSWGGTSADGFVVFLFDGDTPTFNIGDFGGSLGYANGCSPTAGLSGAYIGIALDEYGNFTNPGDRCKNGGPGQRANSVTIRGEGNGVDNGTNYTYLTHNQLPTATQRIDCPSSLCGTSRPLASSYYRQVRITMFPVGGTYNVMVEMRFDTGDSYETVINTYALPTPIYPELKIGFSASTGGSTNNHEIRNLTINVFDKLADKVATGGFTGPLFAGGSAQFRVNVANSGPDAETGTITVTSTLPPELAYTGYSGAGWTCGAVGQLVTCSRTGGLAVGAIAPALSLDVAVSPGAAGSTVVAAAVVSGDVFDNVVANNTVSSTRFVYGGASTGLKPLYMYFSSAGGGDADTLQRLEPSADSTSGTINELAATPWMPLTPALVRPFTINAGNIQVPVCLQKPPGSSGQNRNVRVELDTVGGTVTTIGAQTINNALSPNNNNWRTVTFTIPVGSDINLSAGTRIRARVINQSSGSGVRSIALRSYTAACGSGYSSVELTSSTVVNVEDVAIFDAAWPNGNPVTSTYDDGGTLYLRTRVSDPFGSFDISGVDYSLFDTGNVQVGTTQPMLMTDDDTGNGERTWEYGFTTPSLTGSAYTLRVTAKEGSEGTVTSENATGLEVLALPPLVSVSKVASTATSAPGGTIGYTVNVSNLGVGPAIALQVTDALDAFTVLRLDTHGPDTPFEFVDGSPSSGLVMGTPEYSDDQQATWSYVPTSGGGGAPTGYDGNVTHARVPFTGSLQPGGSFQINYEVQVR